MTLTAPAAPSNRGTLAATRPTSECDRESVRGPQFLGIGTSVPPYEVSQQEATKLLGIIDPRLQGVFFNSGIAKRNLALSEELLRADKHETHGDLLARHKSAALELAREALTRACEDAGVSLDQLDFLCCVTSTGFLVPSLSTELVARTSIRNTCSRVDVVGMGCNAGLNGMQTLHNWARSNQGHIGALVCVEVCSAAYVNDDTIGSAVVNSLFGDGAAAVILGEGIIDATSGLPVVGPALSEFENELIEGTLESMSFQWNDIEHKNSFQLSPAVPYTIGAAAPHVVQRLLQKAGVGLGDIDHWIIHAGGKKVVDSVRANLGLTRYDVRHTLSVLRDHGNLSSASFLFSLERLSRDTVALPGDIGVMMTMGPGASIEAALVHW